MRLAMFESKNRGVWFAWWLDGKDVNGVIGNEVEGMKFKGGVVLTEMKAVMPLMALIPWRSSRTIETNLAEKKGWGKEWLGIDNTLLALIRNRDTIYKAGWDGQS